MSTAPPATRATGRVDWPKARHTIDMAQVATRLLGPAPGRRGVRGQRLWWRCPFHDDRNPSFTVTIARPGWHCFGCGESGDAVDLVRRLDPSLSFPDAVAFLVGEAPSPRSARPPIVAAPSPKARASGLPDAEAQALLEAAQRRLWTPAGAADLAYLAVDRGLEESTIRRARLGSTGPLRLPGGPRGIVLPWWEHGRATLIKIRQPRGRQPRYREVYRRAPALFLGNGPVRPGAPLVLVEGEFDALLLGQALAGLASVATLGSASGRPSPTILRPMLAAFPWFIATDNDPAGDRAAGGWPACARRVRPVGTFKDWTEMHQAGVNLRRWWGELLAGNDRPPLFPWEEVRALRWGQAVGDPEPGIVIEGPLRRHR